MFWEHAVSTQDELLHTPSFQTREQLFHDIHSEKGRLGVGVELRQSESGGMVLISHRGGYEGLDSMTSRESD